MAELIAAVGKLPSATRRTPGQGRPLRRAGAHDRRSAAVGEGGARDLRTADGALRRPPAHTAGDPRTTSPKSCAPPRGSHARRSSYLRSLAEHTLSGELELERLNELDDEKVIAELTAVKGIGLWSAQMFLMFHLERPDVLPDGRPRHPPGDRTRLRPGRAAGPDRDGRDRRAVATPPHAGLPIPVALAAERAGVEHPGDLGPRVRHPSRTLPPEAEHPPSRSRWPSWSTGAMPVHARRRHLDR